jgi:hypothetical protein
LVNIEKVGEFNGLVRQFLMAGDAVGEADGCINRSPLDPLRDALRRVVDPCSIAAGVPVDLLDTGGLVKGLRLDGGTALWG